MVLAVVGVVGFAHRVVWVSGIFFENFAVFGIWGFLENGALWMTIICVRAGVMAVDRMSGSEGYVTGTARKFAAVAGALGGGFAAFAGEAGLCQSAVRLLEAGEEVPSELEAYGLWLKASGEVWERGRSGIWHLSSAEFHAQGSAWQFAFGAMAAGASAEEAARLACEYQPGSCGGPVDVLRI